jgi:hypothetical protein
LLVGREDVDDAVDGLGRRVGVQGGEGEVSRLGDAQGRLDGLQVTHLADQHHVRVLPQRGAQGVGEGVGVGVQLALVHHALLVGVQVLDGILDGDDVLVPLRVDLVSMAARVVDFPDPVGPVTSTRPRGLSHRVVTTSVRPRSRKLRISQGMVRNAPATAPLWKKMLARKRARPLTPKEKSCSSFSSKRPFWRR